MLRLFLPVLQQALISYRYYFNTMNTALSHFSFLSSMEVLLGVNKNKNKEKKNKSKYNQYVRYVYVLLDEV